MPGGDPGTLEQLADQLKDAAAAAANLGRSTRQVTVSIRSDAGWTGDAADSYTAFTDNLSRGTAAVEAPLSRIATAVSDYAVYLRTAQEKVAAYTSAAEAAQVSGNDAAYSAAADLAEQDAATTVANWQAAGERAASEVRASSEQLTNLFGRQSPVQGWLDRQPTPWDSLAGIPELGDPVMPQILKTPGSEFGPEILKTPGAELGPEILLTPPGEIGPLILKDPIFQPGEEILKTPVGAQAPLVNYSGLGDAGGPGTQPPSEVTGYTQHGLSQALGRDGGVGVSESAINDAVENPIQVSEQQGGKFKFVGSNAVVILNSNGKVVTTWARNSSAWRSGQ
jgi:uncharacterized protein YukE